MCRVYSLVVVPSHHAKEPLGCGNVRRAAATAAQKPVARRGARAMLLVHRQEAYCVASNSSRGGLVSTTISQPWGVSAAAHGMRQRAATNLQRWHSDDKPATISAGTFGGARRHNSCYEDDRTVHHSDQNKKTMGRSMGPIIESGRL
jgi:hypothetical protein